MKHLTPYKPIIKTVTKAALWMAKKKMPQMMQGLWWHVTGACNRVAHFREANSWLQERTLVYKYALEGAILSQPIYSGYAFPYVLYCLWKNDCTREYFWGWFVVQRVRIMCLWWKGSNPRVSTVISQWGPWAGRLTPKYSRDCLTLLAQKKHALDKIIC